MHDAGNNLDTAMVVNVLQGLSTCAELTTLQLGIVELDLSREYCALSGTCFADMARVA